MLSIGPILSLIFPPLDVRALFGCIAKAFLADLAYNANVFGRAKIEYPKKRPVNRKRCDHRIILDVYLYSSYNMSNRKAPNSYQCILQCYR